MVVAGSSRRQPYSCSANELFAWVTIPILIIMLGNILMTVRWNPLGSEIQQVAVQQEQQTTEISQQKQQQNAVAIIAAAHRPMNEEELAKLPKNFRDYVVETSSRAYKPWSAISEGEEEGGDKTASGYYGWCVTGEPPASDAEWKPVPVNGIIYVRPHKAQDAIGAGVTLRIAHNVAQRAHNSKLPCKYWWEHRRGSEGFWKRDLKGSIMWTAVRHPAKRAMEEFFHYNVAKLGEPATEEHMIKVLTEMKTAQFLHLMHRSDYEKEEIVSCMDNPTLFMRIQIFDFFDFVAVADRIDESLVAMKMLYGLDDWDIVVLPSERPGEYDDGNAGTKCVKIPEVVNPIPPLVEEFLAKNFTQDNLDFMLYETANKALDKTIDSLGRATVEKAVQHHKQLQQLAEKECMNQAIFACSKEGELQRVKSGENCYEPNIGCAYRCVDELAKKHPNGKVN